MNAAGHVRRDAILDGANCDDNIGAMETTAPFEDVETPLLATDLPPEVVPDKRFRQTVILLSFVFMGLVEVYAFLTTAPLQEIIEDFICHNAFPDHYMNEPTIQDQRCKEPEVQKTLAMVSSWWASCESWVPLLVQIPFGIIADKYGRRPVLFLSFLGILIEGILSIVILLHPQVFSVWLIVPTAVAYLIGGGPPMALAMLWTILCDTIPAVERASVFYRITALGIVLSAVLNPIAAWLMSMNPWLPMWIGITFMALGTFAALLVPETLSLRKQADAARHRRGSVGSEREALIPNEDSEPEARSVPPKAYVHQLLLGAKQNTEHIWRFVLASKSVMLLVAGIGFFFPIKIAFESLLLQYATKRFNWSWSTATYFFTITKVTSLVMLLLILPVLSKLIVRRIGANPLKRDLYMARGSVIFIMLSGFFACVAYAPPVLVAALVTYGLGVGLLPQMRALASGVVEPHTVATLNTIISSMEAGMGSIGAPAFGWLMAKGMELGGVWLGLPYVASTLFALGICLFIWIFRIPRAFL